jgi:hypothetical protein
VDLTWTQVQSTEGKAADETDADATTRVPSVLELVGLIACVAPFVLSAASARWSTVK